MTLSASELRSVLQQTAAYRNALAILTDDWASRAEANPLYQAPMTIADLQFAQDLQAAGWDRGPDFTDYATVQRWIASHRSSLTGDDMAWLQRKFD